MKNHFLQNCLIILSMGLMFSLSQPVKAQLNGFKLADYKNPDYRYQSLETNFNLNSDFNNNQYNLNDDSYWNKNQSSTIGSDFNAGYSRSSNTPSYQGGQMLSLGLGTDFSLQKYNSNIDYWNQHAANSINLVATSENRYYFRSPYYFEVSPTVSFRLQTDFSKTRTPQEQALAAVETKVGSRNINTGTSLGLAIGKGRIEQVQDAQLACYILNDLVKQSRVKAPVSNDDLFELARLITHLKTTRFFDSRIQKIAEITSIDSLLGKRGLKGIADATYFTTINDNWMYANNPARLSGYRIYVKIEPAVNYNSSFHKNDTLNPFSKKTRSQTIGSSYGFNGTLGAIYEKPVSMLWQHSAWATISYGYDITESKFQELLPEELDKVLNYKRTEPAFYSRIGCAAGYYPSTRTWMRASLSTGMNYSAEDKESDITAPYNDKSDLSFLISASLSSYHYLSERLRLEFYLGGSFQSKKDQSGTFPDSEPVNSETRNRQFAGSLSAKLSYSLF